MTKEDIEINDELRKRIFKEAHITDRSGWYIEPLDEHNFVVVPIEAASATSPTARVVHIS